MFPVTNGATSPTTGPKTGRTGSNKPQSVSSALAFEALPVAFDIEVEFLDFRLFFPFLPEAVAAERLLETAVSRARRISLAYFTWPSLAPFSMGPNYVSQGEVKRKIVIPFSHDLPVHSTAQFIWIRVALPSAHVRQYFVLVLKTFPLGTSGV